MSTLPATARAAAPALNAPATLPREPPILCVRHLGLVPFEPTWRAMQRFTDQRTAASADEIWFLEHPPVFTLGVNASRAHLLAAGDIPVVQIDRGGQVTYHGPGQLVVYPLIDLKRARLGIRDFVTALERAVIALAAQYGIRAECRRGGSRGVCRGGEARKRRRARAAQRQLSRPGAERRAGPGALQSYQSVRLRGPADDAARRSWAARLRSPRRRQHSSRTCDMRSALPS